MNRNLNAGKLSKTKLSFHRKCRKSVADTLSLTASFRHGGFVKNKFTRSCSAEQPRFATLPRRGTWSHGMPRLVGRRPMQSSVYGCIVGQRLQGSKSRKQLPICKAWVMQTDHPGLAGMLDQFRCPGGHQSCPVLVESGHDNRASLSATASYPLGLAYFFVLALSLAWIKDRDSVL